MKILFLDIDGVLNNALSNHKDMFPVEPYMVLLIDRIVQETGCKIVLSSSWRHLKNWNEVLSKAAPSLKVIDRTGSDKNGKRGNEIQEWLDAHSEVTKYAIVDDDSDMLKSQMESFFKTEWKIGITDEISKNIINHLKS